MARRMGNEAAFSPCENRRRASGRRAEAWGRAAEAQVEAHYVARGGAVVARRARTAGGEIDLVVDLPETRVFVEVRARRSLAAAAESVNPAKLARLEAAAAGFMAERPTERDLRIDVAALSRDGGFEIFENVTLH